jgi:hypothetical protein
MGDSFTIDEALPFGEMPKEALIAKFEETDTGESEYALEAYQRETLADFRPDPRSLEQDQVQRNNQSAGFLNHRYTGTRSGQEVAHPELFLGFHGPEDRDPRRTFTDPDFNELKKQQDARMKYVRWNSDADNSITGGGWREDHVMAAKQDLIKSSKKRLKIFSTSKDGRREGMNRTWEHRSIAEKIDGGNPDMTDYIRDAAITPQRKTVILSNTELSGGKFYNQRQPDHEFAVARYGDNPRSSRLTGETSSKKTRYDGEAAEYESDQSRAYKNAGVLMGMLVGQKRAGRQDMEHQESTNTQTRKQAEIKRDLSRLGAVMGRGSNEGDFANSDNTMITKSLTPGSQHASRSSISNHAKPDHHYLNAELMYKSVAPGADTLKIKQRIITNQTRHELEQMSTQTRKSDIKILKTRDKKTRSWMEMDGESTSTVNYKTNLAHIKHSRSKNTDGEGFAEESDLTRVYKTSNDKHRITQKHDLEHDMRFLEYKTMDRAVAPLGTKFTRKLTSYDGSMGDIATLS